MHLGLTGEASLESKFLNNHKLKELRMLRASQNLKVLQPWTQRNLLPYLPMVTTVLLLQVCVFQPEKFVLLVVFTCMVRNWGAKGHDSGTCFLSPVTGQLYLWGRGFCNNRDMSIPCASAFGVEICQVSLGWGHGLAISGASLSRSLLSANVCIAVCFWYSWKTKFTVEQWDAYVKLLWIFAVYAFISN